MEGEVWKDIEGYEGLYRISSFGNVFSIKQNKILKGSINKYGYKEFQLSKNKLAKHFRASRLVAINFLLNPENKKVVDHIDRNKLNDNVSNLRWVTKFENSANRSLSKKKIFGTYKGVFFKKGKWESRITHEHVRHHLGYFDLEIHAAFAYNTKAKELYGEFAHLNDIKEEDVLNNFVVYEKKQLTSNYKGVSFDKKTQKWRSNINVDKKCYCLGSFSSEIEAAIAYNKKAKELNINPSRLNQIKDEFISRQEYFDF